MSFNFLMGPRKWRPVRVMLFVGALFYLIALTGCGKSAMGPVEERQEINLATFPHDMHVIPLKLERDARDYIIWGSIENTNNFSSGALVPVAQFFHRWPDGRVEPYRKPTIGKMGLDIESTREGLKIINEVLSIPPGTGVLYVIRINNVGWPKGASQRFYLFDFRYPEDQRPLRSGV